MNFASDNWAGATPEVVDALARANGGFAQGYGGDALTASVAARFSELFEREVEVHFVASGTAANALSMAAAGRPGGLILASTEAHLMLDEFGASEFFTGGMKVVGVPHRHGKISPEGVAAVLARFPEGNRTGIPTTLSLTNATEYGTVYAPDEVAALSALAKARGMHVHMDGARFANAVAALGVRPADITWRQGVDLMSFGGTKNGCWAAEAVVVFNPGRFPHLPILRARAGHVMSKARFVAAQYDAYLADDHWLKSAGHANAMSARLADRLRPRGLLGWEPQANEVFAALPNATIARAEAAGAKFYVWSTEGVPEGHSLVRLVTSFATTEADVEGFLALL